MGLEFFKKSRESLFLTAIFFLPIYQKINHWFFGGFLVVSFLIFFLDKNSRPASKKTIFLLTAIALFFLIQVFGLFHTSDLSYAIKKATRALPFLLYPLAIISFKGSINFKLFERRTFYALTFGCLTAAFICWTNISLSTNDRGLPENTFFGWKKSGIYLTQILDQHPPYLGLLIIAAILFIFKELMDNSKIKSKSKYLHIIFAVILLLFLFNITARNALFFLMFIVFVYLIYKRMWKLLMVQLLIGLIATFIVIKHPSQYYRLKLYYMLGLSDKPIEDQRFSRLTASYEVFKMSPIIGVGPGNDIDLKVKQYALMNDDIAVDNRFNSHNQLFEYLAAYGLIGGFIFIGVNGLLIVFLFKEKQYYYLILLLGFLVSTVTESTFERVLGIQYYCIIVSLGILATISPNDQKNLKVKI